MNECKPGFVHNFALFAILGKKMCINCGKELVFVGEEGI